MNTALIAQLHTELNILCRAHVVIVEDDHGGFLGTRNEAPLYAKLRAATIGGRGDGGKGISARESTPLNVSAVDLYQAITRRIRRAYAQESDKVRGYAPTAAERVDVLTIKWASLVVMRYRRGELDDAGIYSALGFLRGITTSIRELLDPPYRFELTSPCPRCDAEFVTTPETRNRALVVTECKPLDDSFVTCRACNEQWHGIHEARRLSLEMEGK